MKRNELYDPFAAGDMNLIRNIRKLWKHRKRYTLTESMEEYFFAALIMAVMIALLI